MASLHATTSASAWARREQAPKGAVVVLDNEVSGRLRGGEPWTLGGDEGVMMAMVARPQIDPVQEALLWLPASLAAADALSATTGTDHQVLWPDRIEERSSQARRCMVNVLAQLGPGRVEHAVFAVRVDRRDLGVGGDEAVDTDGLVSAYIEAAGNYLDLLERNTDALLTEYTQRCTQMDQRVRVELLPRGEARGRVAAVDHDGFLVLESSTGMIERIAPAVLRSITTVP